MLNFRQVLRAVVGALSLFLFAAAHAPLAAAQTFTLTSSGFTPSAGVDSNSQATAVINVSTTDNYTGSVALTCTSSAQARCASSGVHAQPHIRHAQRHASITVTTGGVSPGTYPVTVTGTAVRRLHSQSVTLYLNVVVTPAAYTLTVSTAHQPSLP